MNLQELLNWRYATKRMTGEKVPREKLDRILDAIQYSASSGGLQPYRIIVVGNDELKKKIQPVANNQPQIVESSHLLVFAVWDSITEAQIDEYINRIASVRGVPVESLAAFATNFKGNILSRDAEANFNWAARSTYIALGTGLIAAANEGVDATPMEGFNPAGLDELLELKKDGLRSVALMALGYRDVATDYLVNAKKVRTPKEQLFQFR